MTRAGDPVDAVLFDLDGTLLDTAPDLVGALNRTLVESGRPEVTLAGLRPSVSHGARAMLRASVDLDPEEPAFLALHQRFLAHYRAGLCRETRLFPGMGAVLDTLEAQSVSWGIVTNKPSRFTDPLLDALGLTARAGCVVSGDTTPESKPHPAPLLHACDQLGTTPGRCLYVGDAPRDIEAGRRAGMRTLVALFGYIGPGDAPEGWGADGTIDTPAELIAWLPATP